MINKSSWKECGNCLWRGKVPNAQTKCPNCKVGVATLHKSLTKTPYEGK